MAGSAGSGVRSAERAGGVPVEGGTPARNADDGHGGPARTPADLVQTRVDDPPKHPATPPLGPPPTPLDILSAVVILTSVS
jgi:hypothetical protein